MSEFSQYCNRCGGYDDLYVWYTPPGKSSLPENQKGPVKLTGDLKGGLWWSDGGELGPPKGYRGYFPLVYCRKHLGEGPRNR